MHSMQTFEPADLEVLARGLVVEPGNVTIETGIAAGEIRAGKAAQGRARLERLLAGKGDSHERGLDFARKVLATETVKAEMEELDALAKKARFGDALDVVKRALARELEPAHRRALEKAQQSLEQFQTIAEAVEAANRGDPDLARRTLAELLAQQPEQSIQADAERLIREIDRHDTRARSRAESAKN
jgi:hypothetical protein